MKKESTLTEAEKEKNAQMVRIMKKIIRICKYGTEEDKDRTEEILNAACGLPERAEG